MPTHCGARSAWGQRRRSAFSMCWRQRGWPQAVYPVYPMTRGPLVWEGLGLYASSIGCLPQAHTSSMGRVYSVLMHCCAGQVYSVLMHCCALGAPGSVGSIALVPFM